MIIAIIHSYYYLLLIIAIINRYACPMKSAALPVAPAAPSARAMGTTHDTPHPHLQAVIELDMSGEIMNRHIDMDNFINDSIHSVFVFCSCLIGLYGTAQSILGGGAHLADVGPCQG